MGDTTVDFFQETLKQLITSSKLGLTIDEKCKLQSLQEEIEYLRGFLKVTEKKRNEHSKLMELVMQIRDVVFKAENFIDLFVEYCFFKRPNAYLYLRKLKRVEKKIKTLLAKVKQIYDMKMYDINGVAVKIPKHSSTGSEGGAGSSRGSNTSKLVKENVVVGFKEEVNRVIEKLDDRGEGCPLEIITIIGTGGGGKTTLAREVYDHPFTLYTFEIRAWVDISQDYNKTMKRDLLIRILELALPGKHVDYEQSSEDKLGEDVHKCLKGRKYLIVMDDIWDIEAWNDMQRSFPKECKGSKVLFTSRQVVQPNISYVPHFLDPLSKNWSWELLQNKWEELSILQTALPSLEVLKLRNGCVGPIWKTSEEGFSQLKYLKLELLDIKKWNASKDQFPRLEVLVLHRCQRLEQIPMDFANLNELREIEVVECNSSVEKSAREIQEQQRNNKGDDCCLNLRLHANTFLDAEASSDESAEASSDESS